VQYLTLIPAVSANPVICTIPGPTVLVQCSYALAFKLANCLNKGPSGASSIYTIDADEIPQALATVAVLADRCPASGRVKWLFDLVTQKFAARKLLSASIVDGALSILCLTLKKPVVFRPHDAELERIYCSHFRRYVAQKFGGEVLSGLHGDTVVEILRGLTDTAAGRQKIMTFFALDLVSCISFMHHHLLKIDDKMTVAEYVRVKALMILAVLHYVRVQHLLARDTLSSLQKTSFTPLTVLAALASVYHWEPDSLPEVLHPSHVTETGTEMEVEVDLAGVTVVKSWPPQVLSDSLLAQGVFF